MVPTGEMPRNIIVVVDRNLVDKVSPGTRVAIMGVASLYNSAAAKKQVGGVAIRTPYIQVLHTLFFPVFVARLIKKNKTTVYKKLFISVFFHERGNLSQKYISVMYQQYPYRGIVESCGMFPSNHCFLSRQLCSKHTTIHSSSTTCWRSMFSSFPSPFFFSTKPIFWNAYRAGGGRDGGERGGGSSVDHVHAGRGGKVPGDVAHTGHLREDGVVDLAIHLRRLHGGHQEGAGLSAVRGLSQGDRALKIAQRPFLVFLVCSVMFCHLVGCNKVGLPGGMIGGSVAVQCVLFHSLT